jgi:hypothetical protein
LSAHGIGRFSEDIDFLVNPEPDNTARWARALAIMEDAASLEMLKEPDIFTTMGPYALRINDEITVDVMPSACGHSWKELQAYRTKKELDGTVVHVLTLDGLLLTKEGMRDKDKADAAVIRRAIAYLRSPGTKE